MTDLPARYRKRPIPVEARQVPPSEDGSAGLELAVWCGGSVSGTYDSPRIFVPTLEGDLVARVGDWIVKGPRGEFWPVKGAIFAEYYEAADVEPAALRDRIAAALDAAFEAFDPEATEEAQLSGHLADAVLAVLPAPADRGAVLNEAADLYASLTDQNEAYDLAEEGAIDTEARIQYDTVRDVVAGLRRMAAEARGNDKQDDGGTAAAVQRGLDVLRVWRDERQIGSEAARLLYEVGAALTDESAAVVRAVEPADTHTETNGRTPCRAFVSGGTVWCCEEGETDCPCICHQPAAEAQQDGAQNRG